jgi:hypothetical protein
MIWRPVVYRSVGSKHPLEPVGENSRTNQESHRANQDSNDDGSLFDLKRQPHRGSNGQRHADSYCRTDDLAGQASDDA